MVGKVWPYDEERSARALSCRRRRSSAGPRSSRSASASATMSAATGQPQPCSGASVGVGWSPAGMWASRCTTSRTIPRRATSIDHRPASRRREMQRHALPGATDCGQQYPFTVSYAMDRPYAAEPHRRRVRPIRSVDHHGRPPRQRVRRAPQPSDASSPARVRSASATSTPGAARLVVGRATCRTSPPMTPPTPSSTTPSAGWCAAR